MDRENTDALRRFVEKDAYLPADYWRILHRPVDACVVEIAGEIGKQLSSQETSAIRSVVEHYKARMDALPEKTRTFLFNLSKDELQIYLSPSSTPEVVSSDTNIPVQRVKELMGEIAKKYLEHFGDDAG